MYSSSSSEYELNNCFHNKKFIPFGYATTPQFSGYTQPLIYYSEVKTKRRKQQDQEDEKSKSNFFTKAFQWYTQELVPLKANISSNNVDVSGFPAWLDEKYNQYKQSSQIEPAQYNLSQLSTIEYIDTSKTFDNKSRTSNKIQRLRRPWKRRKSLIEGDKADFTVKSNQSIKIILNPKPLTEPDSTGCQCPKQSDDKVSHKLKLKSQSLTSVLKEKEIYVIPFDVLEDLSYKELKNNSNVVQIKDKKVLKQIFPKWNKSIFKNRQTKDVWCQCSNGTLQMIDAESQLDKTSNICCCCERKPENASPKIPGISAAHLNIKNYETNISLEKTRPLALNTGYVQTSDHSINLNMVHNFPLFMRVVCPNK